MSIKIEPRGFIRNARFTESVKPAFLMKPVNKKGQRYDKAAYFLRIQHGHRLTV